MYNRYIPAEDGSYHRHRIDEHKSNIVEQPVQQSQHLSPQNVPVASKEKRNFETEELLLIVILLLLLMDDQDEDMIILIAALAFLFL